MSTEQIPAGQMCESVSCGNVAQQILYFCAKHASASVEAEKPAPSVDPASVSVEKAEKVLRAWAGILFLDSRAGVCSTILAELSRLRAAIAHCGQREAEQRRVTQPQAQEGTEK
jgi:hypothetical protein